MMASKSEPNAPLWSFNAAMHSGFAVTTYENVDVVSGSVTDLGEIVLSLSNGPEGGISLVGTNAVAIGGHTKQISTNRTVDISLTYDADTALMKLSDDPSFLNKSWVSVAKTAGWTFTSDGNKSLYVMYADLNGLQSSPYSADVIIDTEAPEISSVKVLNGWAQTKSSTVYVDVTTKESGSGVAEIQISGTTSDLSGAAWQTFSPRMQGVTLTSGAGSRTVYARVKDYAGNLSTVETDTIALGSETVIGKMPYTAPLTLTADYNPYLVNDDVVIDSDLTLQPGVDLRIVYSESLEVKGKLTAIGTVSSRVKIGVDQYATSNECQTYNIPRLILNGGLPGVSELNVVRYADISHVRAEVNGGTFENSSFDSENCSDRGGYITKSGRDFLRIKNNTFNKWGAIVVTEGDGLTELDGNTGSLETFYWQKDFLLSKRNYSKFYGCPIKFCGSRKGGIHI